MHSTEAKIKTINIFEWKREMVERKDINLRINTLYVIYMKYTKTDRATFEYDDKINGSSRIWHEFKEKQQQQKKSMNAHIFG